MFTLRNETFGGFDCGNIKTETAKHLLETALKLQKYTAAAKSTLKLGSSKCSKLYKKAKFSMLCTKSKINKTNKETEL